MPADWWTVNLLVFPLVHLEFNVSPTLCAFVAIDFILVMFRPSSHYWLTTAISSLGTAVTMSIMLSLYQISAVSNGATKH